MYSEAAQFEYLVSHGRRHDRSLFSHDHTQFVCTWDTDAIIRSSRDWFRISYFTFCQLESCLGSHVNLTNLQNSSERSLNIKVQGRSCTQQKEGATVTCLGPLLQIQSTETKLVSTPQTVMLLCCVTGQVNISVLKLKCKYSKSSIPGTSEVNSLCPD
jgi:hypothetical protein